MAFIEPFGVGQMGRLVMLVCQHRTKEDFPLMLAGQRVRMPFIMPSCCSAGLLSSCGAWAQVPRGMWGLSSPARDGTHITLTGR